MLMNELIEGLEEWLCAAPLILMIEDWFWRHKDERICLQFNPNIVGCVVAGNIISDGPGWLKASIVESSAICSYLASPEETATGKDIPNPLYGSDGLPKNG
ncbi:hypothetical protein Tco_0368102 [Tanacetum coccineum]